MEKNNIEFFNKNAKNLKIGAKNGHFVKEVKNSLFWEILKE
jgi:hypothetical protein